MHRKARRTGEAENIRPSESAPRSGANRQFYCHGHLAMLLFGWEEKAALPMTHDDSGYRP